MTEAKRRKAPFDDARRRAFRPLPDWARATTRLVHGGVRPDLNAGAVAPPIYQTSTFRYPGTHSESAAHGSVYLYSRNANPTVEGVEELLRTLEGGEAARLFASGMGALSSSVLSLVRTGDEVVAPAGLYGGTSDLLRRVLPGFGVRVRELDERSAADPESALGARTRLALLETPTNPVLRVHDVRAWSEAMHRRGGLLLVDNTIASPVNQNPLGLGADLVVHSATKYLGGHADLTAGVVVTSGGLAEQIDPHQTLGAPLDPFAAYLLHRSLRTLELRVERINSNARALVDALGREPRVRRIHYPGRASEREEEIAARQMRGRGGLVSFSLHDGARAADRFLSALQIFEVASSFGGVESLASLPRTTSHRHWSREEREACGIDEGFVRLSVGVEDPRDLVRDVHDALARTDSSGRSPTSGAESSSRARPRRRSVSRL